MAAGCGGNKTEQPPKPEPVLSPAEPEKPSPKPEPDASGTAALSETTHSEPPFVPPPLEALDRDTKWIDRPVRDALADLALELEKEPPLATPEEALALENASKGITVNAVCPGYVKTDLIAHVSDEMMAHFISNIPVGRIAEADEIGHCIVFLAAENSGFITGSTLSINGGAHMA